MKQNQMKKRNKGFTLIEMLVVIAVIAILVAMVVPTVAVSTKKARAATDAANIRSVLGLANSVAYNGDKETALKNVQQQQLHSKLVDGAELYMVYEYPGFVDVFYLDGSPDSTETSFYGLDYMADVAENGESSLSTSKPSFPGSNVEWVKIAEIAEGS